MIIVTAKIHPDLDGYACAFVYSEFLNKIGQEAVGISVGEPQREVIFLNKEFGIEQLSNDSELIKRVDQIILVDASSLKGVPEGINPEKVIEIIDHRESPEAKKLFPNAKIQIERVGAAATLIAEKFRDKNIAMSKNSAILLHCAIASNTLNFKVSMTTKRDRTAYEWLGGLVNIPPDLVHRMFTFKSQFNDESFRKTIISDFKEIKMGNKLVGIAQLEVIGLRSILKQRKQHLFEILEELTKEKGLDYIFLAAVDIENGINLFATNHESTKRLLENTFNISFGKNDFVKKAELS